MTVTTAPARRGVHGVVHALLAAALFGASTPLAKLLLADISPVMLAGLLYGGSGMGLGLWWLMRRRRAASADAETPLQRRDWPWLAGAVAVGGVLGPLLLLFALRTMPAADASLLLNLESVLTALLAWIVFRENVDRRVLLGMLAIVIGGFVLSWSGWASGAFAWSSLGIAGACLCWAIDNNLTRIVSGGDPVQIAAIKGVVAGIVNIGLALALGNPLPSIVPAFEAACIGLAGYGISLVLFVLALRHLGTARTGAYFSTAPFVGAALSLVLLGESPGLAFWLAGALMAIGVVLHVSERHEHDHAHEPLAHAHRHSHDDHHQHEHDASWDGREPHAHFHVHAPLVHRHPHYPDIHHRHRH